MSDSECDEILQAIDPITKIPMLIGGLTLWLGGTIIVAIAIITGALAVSKFKSDRCVDCAVNIQEMQDQNYRNTWRWIYAVVSFTHNCRFTIVKRISPCTNTLHKVK